MSEIRRYGVMNHPAMRVRSVKDRRLAITKRFNASGGAMLALALILCLPPPLHAQRQQRLTNVGQHLFYEQQMIAYDTVNRDSNTTSELARVPSNNGTTADTLEVVTGALGKVGSYHLISTGSGSNTFDIKASSQIVLRAATTGSYNEETAPDDAWDLVTASTHTTYALYDVVTVTADGYDKNDPALFYFEWMASGNTLDVVQEAALGPASPSPLGPIALIEDGWSTDFTYEAGLTMFVNGEEVSRPYSLSDKKTVAPPTKLGPVEETINLPEQDVHDVAAIEIGVPFVVEIDLDVNLDMTLQVAGIGTPKFFSATLDFGNTFDSVLFEPRDLNGTAIPNANIVSALGIDYAAAAPGVVPEPSPGALLSLACIVTLACCRTRGEIGAVRLKGRTVLFQRTVF